MQVEQDVEEAFRQIVSVLEGVEPEDGRITVMVSMPHLRGYGRPETNEFTYRCPFPVKKGDLVLCPPPPRGNGEWLEGVVTALHGNGYRGPAREVKMIEERA